MLKININGKDFLADEGQTILDVARQNGIEIPTMCHDERVAAYGACGICCVEAENMPRLLRSCSTLVTDGMVIKTDTPRVIKSRTTSLELLLSDHTGDCRPPCVLECPGQTDCMGYVNLIAEKKYADALELIKDRLPLPASIGRVCPHPCEKACRRQLVEEPISIAALKYFAADIDLGNDTPFLPEISEPTGKKVAIIGGGPGGLSSAYFLRQKGHDITIYDAMPQMGGMLRYGIPEYRLPKSIVDKEIEIIEKMGVKLINNMKIGEDITLDEIRGKYDAVIVAVGAWSSIKLRCAGEDLDGVTGGIDFLRNVYFNRDTGGQGRPPLRLFIKGKKIAVVGGGNTAMDACRTAVRLGADKVYNIYRRTKAEMPAEQIEIAEAEEEGVIFKNLTNPIEIIEENGKAKKVRLQIMELGEADKSGRRAPVPVEGKEELLDVDLVIVAIGQGLNVSGFEAIELTKYKTISADENSFRTNLDGVFAIGDATNKGADIAISAIGEARRSADVIDSYLYGELIPYKKPYLVEQEVTAKDFEDREKISRALMPHRKSETRRTNFEEVNFGLSEDAAVAEANRCLKCGCHDFFECKLISYAHKYDVKPEKYEGEKNIWTVDDSHPQIHRNMNKCILCGLCVRICEEVEGLTALGLVGRGFKTVAEPELGLPLIQSCCNACGKCVDACPTGALGKKD